MFSLPRKRRPEENKTRRNAHDSRPGPDQTSGGQARQGLDQSRLGSEEAERNIPLVTDSAYDARAVVVADACWSLFQLRYVWSPSLLFIQLVLDQTVLPSLNLDLPRLDQVRGSKERAQQDAHAGDDNVGDAQEGIASAHDGARAEENCLCPAVLFHREVCIVSDIVDQRLRHASNSPS